MERLSDNAIAIVNELHTERIDYNAEYVPLIDALNKLAAYENAEENGTLVRLPCKVGDTVYIISKVTNPKFSKNGNDIINGVTSETKLEIHKKPFYYDLLSFMGDLCFLTREEAEKALKARDK